MICSARIPLGKHAVLQAAGLRSVARVVAVSVALLAGCTGAREASVAVTESPDAGSAYTDSVFRAAVFEPSSVHALYAIPADGDAVAVVTWTPRPTADEHYPFGETTVDGDVWVTLVPEVRQLCARYPRAPDALRLRLQQLLGLPPRDEEHVFVEMKVHAKDIFRPCPDPDPTKAACANVFPEDVDVHHKAWLAEQVLQSYRTPQGFPWTRLGYTYDWNTDGPRFGASEYVLRKGSKIIVKEKAATAAYCQPQRS